jgi:hypothetical protein
MQVYSRPYDVMAAKIKVATSKKECYSADMASFRKALYGPSFPP